MKQPRSTARTQGPVTPEAVMSASRPLCTRSDDVAFAAIVAPLRPMQQSASRASAATVPRRKRGCDRSALPQVPSDRRLSSTIGWVRVPMALSLAFRERVRAAANPALSEAARRLGPGGVTPRSCHIAVHDDGVRVAVVVARVDGDRPRPPSGVGCAEPGRPPAPAITRLSLEAARPERPRAAAQAAVRRGEEVLDAVGGGVSAFLSEIASDARRSVGCGSRTAAISLVPPSGHRQGPCSLLADHLVGSGGRRAGCHQGDARWRRSGLGGWWSLPL